MTSTTSSRMQLGRGAACIRCRVRKTKCDGKRPICGPCQAAHSNQCGYTDEAPWTTHALEEQISVMENRIGDLQNEASPSITLHHPYAPQASADPPPPLDIRALPQDLRRSLINALLSRAPNFHFFLEVSRFASSESYAPSPALRSATYLMGAYLNLDINVAAQAKHLLKQALHDVTHGLSVDHPQRILHLVQGEVLLAQYFFLNGRLIEGKYRISTAISLVLGARFHKIRAAEHSPPPGRSGLRNLPPPTDALEELEQVNALWTVLILNHCWNAADGATPDISYDRPESRIDAPWPLDISHQSQFPTDLTSSHTIQEFLQNAPDNGRSLFALHAKAAILFEQASLLFRGYTPNMTLHDGSRFQASFVHLDNLIQSFVRTLPPLRGSQQGPITSRKLLLIHVLARVALIQLHSPLTGGETSSHALSLVTAEEVVACLREVKLHDFPFIDPFMGVLCVTTAKVFVEEISIIRTSGSNSSPWRRAYKDLKAQVEAIMAVMAIFAPRSPLFGLTRSLEMTREPPRKRTKVDATTPTKFANVDDLQEALNTSQNADSLSKALSTLRNQLTVKPNEGPISPSDPRLLFAQQWIGRAPGANDLFSIWQNIENRQNSSLNAHSHTLLTLVLSVLACLLNLFSSHYTYHSYGLPIIKTLLSPQYNRKTNAYLAGSHNDLILSTLKLLNGMSDFASGKERRQLLDGLGWDTKTLQRLLNMRRKGKNEQVDPLGRPDIRTLTLLLIMSFLGPTSPSSLKIAFFEQQTEKFLSIFKGLVLDPYVVIRQVLSLCWEGVWGDVKLPKKVKVGVFGEVTMSHLLKLYDRTADESSNENDPQITADLVHHFLLALCTRPGQGVCFRDRGWYPPLDGESAESESSQNGAGGRSRVYNKILSNVLKNLKANEDLRQQELALRIMGSCPELVAGYWPSVNLTLEPRLSSRWIANIALFGRIISLSVAEETFLLSSGGHYNPTPPPLATIMDNILPTSVNTKSYFSKGLQSSAANDPSVPAPSNLGLVQLCTAQAICQCLTKYTQVRDAMLRVADALEEDSVDYSFNLDENSHRGQWRKRLIDLDREVRRKVPDFQVVVSFVGRVDALEQSVSQTSSTPGAKVDLLSEVAHRLLWLYQRCLPEVSGEARFDVGKLLATVDASLISDSSDEEASTSHDLKAVKQIHVLRLLKESEQFRASWIGKAGSSKHSNLYILLKAIALFRAHRFANTSTTHAMVCVLTGLLDQILGGSILFQQSSHVNLADSEVSVWISCLPQSFRISSTCPDGAVLSDEIESVTVFLDECIHRCIKTPYRYIDDLKSLVEEIRNQEANDNGGTTPNEESGGLPSPLLMTLIEQLKMKVERNLLTPSDVLSLALFFRKLLHRLSTLMNDDFGLKLLRGMADRVDTALQSGFATYPLISKAIRRQIRLIQRSLRYNPEDRTPSQDASAEEVQQFLGDVEKVATPSTRLVRMATAYELVDWVRLVEHPLQVEDVIRVTKVVSKLHPEALSELAWAIDMREGLLWQGMDVVNDMLDQNYLPSFELLLLHSTEKELSNPDCLAVLASSAFGSTPSAATVVRAIRAICHALPGLADGILNLLLLLQTILRTLSSKVSPDACSQIKRYVFVENSKMKEIFLFNSNTVSALVYEVLAGIVNAGLPHKDEGDRKLVSHISSYWIDSFKSLAVSSNAQLFARIWIQYGSLDEICSLLDYLLVSDPSHVVLDGILEALKVSESLPGFEDQIHQHLQSLLKLRVFFPTSDRLEDLIERSLCARLPLFYRGYSAEEQESTLESVVRRAELRWNRHSLPPPPEIDMHAYLERKSCSRSTVDIICHSIYFHSPSHYEADIRGWLSSNAHHSPCDFALVAHAYLDCHYSRDSHSMPDDEAQLWSKHLAYLIQGANHARENQQTRTAFSRSLSVLLRSRSTVFHDSFIKEIQKTPVSALCLELLQITGLTDPQRVALVDHGLQWVVRILTENEEMDPVHVRIIEELTQVMADTKAVKAHLAEPVLTAVVQNRLLNKTSLNLAAAILQKVQFKPLIVNRNLQGIVQSPILHKAFSGLLRDAMTDVISELFHMHPSNTCQPSHLEPLVSQYRGTLSPADRKLLRIFHLFEEEKDVSVVALLSKWSSSGSVDVGTNTPYSGLDALRSLDSIMVYKTYSKYPQWRRYSPDEDKECPEQGKVDAFYDPLFVIPLVGHVFLECPPKSAVDWVEVFRTNIVSLLIRALSAKDADLREIAKTNIALIWKRLETADMLEKPHVVHILSLLRDALAAVPSSTPGVTPRLPSYTTLLLAHALRGVFYPSNFTYPLTAKFLLQRPQLDITDVPLLYSMLYSSTDENGQWKKDRAWMLRFLTDGMQGRDDWRVFRRRHTWDLVASLFESEQRDRAMRRGVLELLANLTCIPDAAMSLLLKSGLLSWIEIQVSNKDAIKREHELECLAWIKVIENILVVADKQKMETITQGEWRTCMGRCLMAILDTIAASALAQTESAFVTLHICTRVVLRLSLLDAESMTGLKTSTTCLYEVISKGVDFLRRWEGSISIDSDGGNSMEDTVAASPHSASQLFDVPDVSREFAPSKRGQWVGCVENLWRACMVLNPTQADSARTWDALSCRLLVCRAYGGSRVQKDGVSEWVRTEVIRNLASNRI
ncbi:hypothetical protein VNI00_009702 [Paramarasmius palmivorus]|uniref:Zn(2)-C6 fungal-type domain-containing protein n=1 Tax=Paramarasmius palmivorus TaxID=297713 RepID=A0AAW0CS58_9AGAR